jgi:hypothetical protein
MIDRLCAFLCAFLLRRPFPTISGKPLYDAAHGLQMLGIVHAAM